MIKIHSAPITYHMTIPIKAITKRDAQSIPNINTVISIALVVSHTCFMYYLIFDRTEIYLQQV